MGLFGKILAAPFRVANVPLRAVEKVVDPDSERGDDDNILSSPLEAIAEAFEEIDD